MTSLRTQAVPLAAGPAVDYDNLIVDLRRSRRLAQAQIVAGWIVIATVGIVLWEIASRTILTTFWISSPGLVARRLIDMFVEGRIWSDIATTLAEMYIGFIIGATAALIVGLILGLYPRAFRLLTPYLVGLYALPKVAVAPLLILYFGIDIQMKIALSAIVTFFLVFFTTVDAVRLADWDLIGVVRVAGATRLQLVRVVLLPSALNGILHGMKVALPYALQAALFGEILASNRGMGYSIASSSSQFDVTGVFAGLVVVTIVAVVANQLLDVVVSRTQAWRPQARG